MNRTEWKALFSDMRKAGQKEAVQSIMLHHGSTYWTAHYMRSGSDKGLHLSPSIICDRSLSSRIAEELAWARQYRHEAACHKRNGAYWAGNAANSIKGAKLCITSAALMRISAGSRHAFEQALAQGEAIGAALQ